MAQTIDIIIKISQRGESAIKDVAKRLNELNMLVAATDTAPVERLNKSVAQISTTLKDVAADARGIVKSIVSQADSAVAGSVDKFSVASGKAIETFYARAGVAIGSIFFFGRAKIAGLMEQAFAAPTALAGIKVITNELQSGLLVVSNRVFGQIIDMSDRLGGMLTGASTILVETPAWLLKIQNSLYAIGLPAVAEELVFINYLTGHLFGYLARSATIGGALLFGKVWLGEVSMLVNRLIGQGESAMTPLEHATRLVSTLDVTTHSIGLTAGQFFKTATLGILTFVGPFSGIIAGLPFLNSAITSLLGLGLRFRTTLFASFGSARAQFTLIFLDLKSLALAALPTLLEVAKSFKSMRGEATYAGDAIRKAGNDTDKLKALQGLSRMKLPIGAQIQAVSVEIKTALGETILQLNKISILLQRSMGLAKTEIVAIDAEAKKLTQGAVSGIEKSAQAFDKIGQKSSIFDQIKRQYRALGSFFQTNAVSAFFLGGQDLTKIAVNQLSKVASIPKDNRPYAGQSFTPPGKYVEQKSLRLSRIELFPTIQEGEQAKEAIRATDGALKSYHQTLTSVGRSTENLAKVTTGSFSQIAQAAAKIPEQVTGLAAKISEIVKASLPVSDLAKRVSTYKSPTGGYSAVVTDITKSQRGIMSSAVEQARMIAGGAAVPAEEVAKKLQKLALALAQMQGQVGASVPSIKLLTESLQNAGNIRLDKIKDAFPVFDQKIKEIIKGAEKLTVSGQDTGNKFVSLLIEGIKKDTGKSEEAVKALADLIASYFPQSPAKKGALRGLQRSGGLIPHYIASGMESARSQSNKAANDIAEGIAKHFPRSLPVLGPLVKLPLMGLKIAQYIAGGITSGLQYVIDAARKLAEPIAKIFETSEQIGVSVESISALQNAFARLGGSVEDAKFAFNQINSLLGRTLNDEELVKVRQLGIDLASVRSANEPTLALLLQVSDAIKGLPPQSEKFRAALELLGITAQSSLVTVLRQGGGAIKDLMAQGVELGVVVDENTAKAAKAFVGINAQIDLVKTSIMNGLISSVLPRLVDSGNKVLEIIGRIRPQITAVLTIAGNGLATLGEMLVAFVNLAINDPKKAMDISIKMLESFWTVVKEIFYQSFLVLAAEVKFFVVDTFLYVGRLSLALLGNLFDELMKEASLKLGRLKDIVFGKKLDLNFTIDAKTGLPVLIKEVEKAIDGADWGKALEKSLVDAEEATKKFGSSARETLAIFANKDNGNRIVDAISGFASGIKDSFSGSDLSGIAKRFQEIFTIKNFDETLTKIENIKEEQIKAVREVASESTKINEVLAAENAARERREESRRSSAARLQELQMRSRVNPFDEGLKNDIALMEMEAKQKDELAAYEKLESDKTKVAEFSANQRKELENLASQQRHEATLKQLENFQSAATNVGQIFGDLYDLSKGKVKEFFYIQKAAALAEAVVNTAAGITKALAQGGVWGIAQGAMVGAAGAIQVAKIVSSALGFNEGGQVPGVTKGRDHVNAMLDAGEHVMQVPAVRKYGVDFMDAVNNMRLPREAVEGIMSLQHNVPGISEPAAKTFFGTGGQVVPVPAHAPAAAQQAKQQPPTIVNVIDPDMLSQFVATSKGENAIWNLLSNNPRKLKALMAK